MSARLFTPGPLTTDPRVRAAMADDWGSRDPRFVALTTELRERIAAVANADDSHVAVPIQGSGTFAIEAMIATLIGAEHRLLVLVNGAYGRRIAAIAHRYGRAVETIEWPEREPVDPARVADALAADAAISHVAIVQCETTTGILNPWAAVAGVVADAGRILLVDAMSGFGALPIDLAAVPAGAVAASSNKCLEGVPGIGFVLVERGLLAAADGRSPSLSLDLHDQQRGFAGNGQWRFTPPVQVVAALVAALRLLAAEGGPPARLTRYRRNHARVAAGLEAMGYRPYLDAAVQSPIIATFHAPAGFDFEAVYARLAAEELVIYPGKLTQGDSFRIGCIGALTPADFDQLVAAFPPVS